MNFDFVRPGTMALWTFDGNDGTDSSPNNNDLTVGIPAYSLGKFGTAIEFDGDQEHCLRASTTSDSLYLSTFSILCWIKTTDPVGSIFFSFIDNDYSVGTGCCIGVFDVIWFGVGDGNSWFDGHSGTINICDGDWHWIVVTRGTQYTRIYVDAILNTDESNLPLAYSFKEIATLGALYNPTLDDYRYLYPGSIDAMHIIASELSYVTIRRMYAFQMGWI